MKTPFDSAVAALRTVYNRFDPAATPLKHRALARLAKTAPMQNKSLLRCHEMLLFTCAHPADPAVLALAERELARLAAFLKRHRNRLAALLTNQGLPFAPTLTRFSHDCVRWLLAHPHCRIEIDHAGEPALDLNAVLALTLPPLERSETTAGLDNDALLDALRVPKARHLEFFVNELSRFDAQPYVKDHLFDALDLFVRVTPTDRAFSKAYNRLPIGSVYFQGELVRSFDHVALMNSALPPPRALDADGLARVVEVVKNTMTLTSRETDPATYLDERSLRVFDLERGLAVAIFGMTPQRQLPLESYVGFTLFKNGMPAAYGGSWVLGARANFGMNIFEPYRGGESGFMMCEVLRVYRQMFGVQYFEVDAHQFGLDNPDGIASGAFWFYYRYGFRPLDKQLASLARSEKEKIASRKGYRSSEKTLLRFTGSNVALNFDTAIPPRLEKLTASVTRMVQREYGANRIAAERDCVARLEARTPVASGLGADQRAVLAEVALLARALKVDDPHRLDALARMVHVKPADPYAYQQLLLDFFGRAH